MEEDNMIKRFKTWLKRVLYDWLIEDKTYQHRIIQTPTDTIVLRVNHEVDDYDVSEIAQRSGMSIDGVMKEIQHQMLQNLFAEIVKGEGLIEITRHRDVARPNTPLKMEMKIRIVKMRTS